MNFKLLEYEVELGSVNKKHEESQKLIKLETSKL